jgi:predicted RNA-binding protein with PUA-like domain
MPAKKVSARPPAHTPSKGPTKKAPVKQSAKKAAAKKAPQSMPYEEGKWSHVFTRATGERRYWLIKSEPDVFSFDDLMAAPKKTTGWDSVRNSTARNFMRDGMKKGDRVFYYHSNADPSAVVGICEVVREGHPDPTALDPAHEYFDPASTADVPTWYMVEVRAVSKLARPVSLHEIKATPALSEMALVKQGRLSVTPVTEAEWNLIVAMSERG